MSQSNDNHEDSVSDDWAAAMSEQAEAGAPASDDADDPWAAALAEQEAAEAAPSRGGADSAPAASAQSGSDSVFKPLEPEAADTAVTREMDMIMEIPVTLSVQLGQTRLTIRELLDLAKGSIVELDGLAGEPMDILINGYLIAQGEVVVVDDRYGIRITEIVTRAERIHKLNR